MPTSSSTSPARSRRTWALLVAASFCLTAPVPFLAVSPYGTLSEQYTDHVRQPYLAWVFLHRGFDIYRLPLGEVSKGIDYAQAISEWPEVPYVYPPGVLALYLPMAALGQWVPMSQGLFARVSLLYLLVLTHLTFWLILQLLERLAPGGRVWVGLCAWLVLIRLALQGQYDPVWLAFGVVALSRLHEGKTAACLRWICGAALLHYRAVVLVPLGWLALVGALRSAPPRRWPWGTFLGVAATGVVCILTFVWMAPGAVQGGAATPPLWTQPGGVAAILMVMGGTLITGWVTHRYADALVTGFVLVGAALAFIDTHHWWHAALLLFAPLAVGVLRPPRRAAWVRVTLVLWLSLVQMNTWTGNPLWLLKDANRAFRAYRAVH